jgi:hypothetical protein
MNPWTYDISPDRRQALIIDDEGYTVAEIAGHTDMTETVELMTAAPDMLAALQRVREVLLWNLGDDARIDAAFDAVNAAIFKATYTMEHKQ